MVSAAGLGMSDGLGHGDSGKGGWRNSDDQELIQRFFLVGARIIFRNLNFFWGGVEEGGIAVPANTVQLSRKRRGF